MQNNLIRIFFAFRSMTGQVIQIFIPKYFQPSNPFSALFFYSLISLPIFPIISKVFYGYYYNTADINTWIAYIVWWGIFGTTGFILALQYGGKVNSIIMIQSLAIVISGIIGYLFLSEKINNYQFIWILLVCIWTWIFFYFNKFE